MSDPALRSLDARPHNLPIQLTSLIGREGEVATASALLRTAGRRLVTLLGPGGIGKTRLALQVGADLVDDFPDGVFFVDLAPVTDPALVLSTIAQSLGLRDEPSRPLRDTVREALRAKRLLLLLDNFEQVVEAVALIADLLTSCPHLSILVTSRTLLQIQGEQSYDVPPLTLPLLGALASVERLSQYAAVRLFIDRVQAIRADFAVTNANAPAVAEICVRLDGIPLAIELAAARVRALGVEQIAARLDDRFRLLTGGSRTALRRQQTLLATLDWSYQLLSEAEQGLLRRLAVFAGGWTLEAAEAVGAGHDIAMAQVLDLLTALVDKSMVIAQNQGEQARYRMLETIREFAREKLDACGEGEAIRNRHRDWCLDLAERAWPELTRANQVRWFRTLDAEIDNLRAALSWTRAREADAAHELRLVGALGRYWSERLLIDEAREHLQHALARADRRPSQALALTLTWAGTFAYSRGDLKRAKELGEEAVAVARAIGDGSLQSLTLRHLALTEDERGEDAQADEHVASALLAAEQAGDPRERAFNLARQGWYAVQRGDLARARARLALALPLARESGDGLTIGFTLSCLSGLEAGTGNLDRAWDLAQMALRAEEAITSRREIYQLQAISAALALRPRDSSLAGTEVREALGRAIDAGEPQQKVAALRAAVLLLVQQGNPTAAARLDGAVGAHRVSRWLLRQALSGSHYEDAVATARAALGPAEFAAARAAGQAMTLEEALAYALERLTRE